MTFLRPATLMSRLAILTTVLFLAACESAEDKAEGYYQSALTLMEAGDSDRAMVELRNVFQYDGFHKEARRLLAELMLDKDDVGGAYSQYLRLVEQYPDDVDTRLILAELALDRSDWAEVERHGQAALELAPDQTRTQAIAAAIAYRAARLDDAPVDVAVAQAMSVRAEDPDNRVVRRIIIDALMLGDTPADALPEVEAWLTEEPLSLEMHSIKLRLLAVSEDEAAAVAQLEEMYRLFPDNTEVRNNLITYYMSQRDFDAAEALLRGLAGDVTGDTPGHVTVVQFLQQARGNDAAKAELAALVAANDGTPNADLYRAMQAAIVFEEGDRDTAIATLQEVIAGAEPSDQINRIKSILARMLQATGNQVGARALVEEILAADSSNVDALKMRAAWQIDEDKPDAAIEDLRAALNQAPRDPQILTLMAQAHERAGSPELAGERLALAVEVTNAAPGESLRYAQFLLREGRVQAAESVLLDARRTNPGNLEVVSRLADLWLNQQNWDRARELLAELQTFDSDQARTVATALESAILMGQDQTDESLRILQDNLSALDDGSQTTVTIVLANIRAGRTDEARTFLDEALARTPDDLTLRLLSGSLDMVTGKPDSAEEAFVAVLEEAPGTEAAVRLLFSLRSLQGRTEDAVAVLDAGIAANPEAASLLWIKASALEQGGDFEGAIAIYEDLYARDSSNVIVANNLASLITTHRTGAEDLERAFAIARRLRAMDVPAFQDTYGWIEARRGNYTEALAYLRPAAAGLTDDPLAQYHLGMALAGAGETAEAITVLQKALELAGDSPLPQFDTARAKLAELEAAQ